MKRTARPPGAGARDPTPTPALERLRAFVNTNDIEDGHDALATPEKLRDWLRGRGLPGGRSLASPDGHRRTLEIREGLRALGRVNNGEPVDTGALERLNRAARSIPLVASLDPYGWQLQPGSADVDAFLADIIATAVRAMGDGSWSRVKACRNDGCRWLFYDHSRNRSGTWCTMTICGSRMKARAYRARRRDTSFS